MINLEAVVWSVVYLLGAGAVFGLLYWLIGYLESKLARGEGSKMFFNGARIFLVVVGVLLLIFLILSFITGKPLFRWRGP